MKMMMISLQMMSFALTNDGFSMKNSSFRAAVLHDGILPPLAAAASYLAGGSGAPAGGRVGVPVRGRFCLRLYIHAGD